jgi:hypothetical protein
MGAGKVAFTVHGPAGRTIDSVDSSICASQPLLIASGHPPPQTDESPRTLQLGGFAPTTTSLVDHPRYSVGTTRRGDDGSDLKSPLSKTPARVETELENQTERSLFASVAPASFRTGQRVFIEGAPSV